MKILMLCNHLVVVNFRKELLSKLFELGHEVYVSFPFNNDDSIDHLKNYNLINIKIDRHGTNIKSDLNLYKNYIKILEQIKPDFVLTYTIKCNIYGGLACKKLNIPYISTITGLGTTFQEDNIQKFIVTFLYKLSMRKVKKIFCQNEENKQIIINNNISNKICLVPGSGVNIDEFDFSEYPKDEGKLNFLFIGRLMKDKGVEELFESIERLNKDYHNLNFEFIGWYEDNYKEKVNELVNKGYIKYYGFQNNVKPFIKKAHCIVIPSYHEGMCNALLEAESMGRPVVTTNISGCKETVIEGKTGFLCESKSVDSLYDSLKEFIDLPYEDKVKMGRKARNFMVHKFDKKIVVDMYLDNIIKDK